MHLSKIAGKSENPGDSDAIVFPIYIPLIALNGSLLAGLTRKRRDQSRRYCSIISYEWTTSPPNNKTQTQLKNHFNKSSHLKILLKESSKSVHRFNLPGPRYRCLTGRLYSRSQDFILNLIPLEVSPPRWCVSQPTFNHPPIRWKNCFVILR